MQSLGAAWLAVYQEYTTLAAARAFKICQKLIVICMTGEGIERANLRAHRVGVAEDGHVLCAVQYAPPQSVLSAKAYKQYGVFGIGDAQLEVVQNAPGLAHARGGDDDGSALFIIDELGLRYRAAHVQIRKGEGISALEKR